MQAEPAHGVGRASGGQFGLALLVASRGEGRGGQAQSHIGGVDDGARLLEAVQGLPVAGLRGVELPTLFGDEPHDLESDSGPMGGPGRVEVLLCRGQQRFLILETP